MVKIIWSSRFGQMSLPPRSMIHCNVLCNERSCSAFAFDEMKGICQIGSKLKIQMAGDSEPSILDVLVNVAGYIFWKKMTTKTLHLKKAATSFL